MEEFGDRLASYSGRALLVMGEQDAFGEQWVDRSAELLSSAEVERALVPGAGHLVSVERPDALLARVTAFLGG